MRAFKEFIRNLIAVLLVGAGLLTICAGLAALVWFLWVR